MAAFSENVSDDFKPLQWDDGAPWKFCINVTRDAAADSYVIAGLLRRQDQERTIAEPLQGPEGVRLRMLRGKLRGLHEHRDQVFFLFGAMNEDVGRVHANSHVLVCQRLDQLFAVRGHQVLDGVQLRLALLVNGHDTPDAAFIDELGG